MKKHLLILCLIGWHANAMNHYYLPKDQGFIFKASIDELLTVKHTHNYYLPVRMLCGRAGISKLEINNISIEYKQEIKKLNLNKSQQYIFILIHTNPKKFITKDDRLFIDNLQDFQLYLQIDEQVFKIEKGQLNKIAKQPPLHSVENIKKMQTNFFEKQYWGREEVIFPKKSQLF